MYIILLFFSIGTPEAFHQKVLNEEIVKPPRANVTVIEPWESNLFPSAGEAEALAMNQNQSYQDEYLTVYMEHFIDIMR